MKAAKVKSVTTPRKRAKGAGRPRYVPTAATEEQVKKMAGLGMPADKIAMVVAACQSSSILRNRLSTLADSTVAEKNDR